jgi:hypothetical protein
MKPISLFLLSWLLCLASGHAQTPLVPSAFKSILPGGSDKWELVWSDEFDKPDAELDKTWQSQNGPSGHILCSRWRENAVVTNGLLRLINGKEIRRVKNEFSHSPASVWLSLAIIPWSGRVTDAIHGTAMEVDYVRIYRRRK